MHKYIKKTAQLNYRKSCPDYTCGNTNISLYLILQSTISAQEKKFFGASLSTPSLSTLIIIAY